MPNLDDVVKPFCLFPIYRASAGFFVVVFSAHTQNGQLADREAMFATFDKKGIGLELQTTPFNVLKRKMCGFAMYSA